MRLVLYLNMSRMVDVPCVCMFQSTSVPARFWSTSNLRRRRHPGARTWWIVHESAESEANYSWTAFVDLIFSVPAHLCSLLAPYIPPTRQAGYLFPGIAKRRNAYLEANPDCRPIISLGIGDTTQVEKESYAFAMLGTAKHMRLL